jgi:hypothetical protein
MSQKYEKLKSLLKELFQLDQPELDFGLYRIMHAKAGEARRPRGSSRTIWCWTNGSPSRATAARTGNST